MRIKVKERKVHNEVCINIKEQETKKSNNVHNKKSSEYEKSKM